MKKITELKRTTYSLRESRNALGKIVHTRVPVKLLSRKVNTIQGWPRFGHYLIDFAILYGLIYLIESQNIVNLDGWPAYGFGFGQYMYHVNLTNIFGILLYYTILEGSMGRTLGKFATNSYVINEYAQRPDFGVILLRSCCRLIPFYAFSCLGERGWHDRISKTFVVSKTEWETLKKLLAEDNIFSDDSEILDA